jgi:hypothetical protein
MRFAAAALVMAIALLPVEAWQKERAQRAKGPRPPDLAVVTFKVHREPGVVAVEGRVRNNSDRVLRGLVVFFEFLESDGKMITRKNTMVTNASVEPGEEEEFLTQTVDPVRAVHVRLDAEDKDGRYLRVDKPGPYAIE